MSSPTLVVPHPEPRPLIQPPELPEPPPAGPPRRGFVTASARWSARHRWIALTAWMVFVVVAFVGGQAVGTTMLSDAQSGVGESGRADRAIASADFGDHPVENVLITARSGALDVAAARQVAEAARPGYQHIASVAAVGEPVVSPNGKAVLLPVSLAVPLKDADDTPARTANAPVTALTATLQQAHPDLRIEQVGEATLAKAVDDSLGRDFKTAEMLSIPVTLVILVVAFGALLAAAVPVVLALTCVIGALGLSAFASHVFPVTDALASVVLLIGLAVGVDYSLFYVRRSREERHRGAAKLDAIEIAAATSGRAVVTSGLTVAIAMAGMFLAGDPTFESFAVGSILVVLVAVLGSITVLPAILAILGDAIERPRVPFVHRLQRTGPSRFWTRLMRKVTARPALTFGISAGILVALALPALGMRTTFTGSESVPRSIPGVQAYDRMTAAFPSEGDTHTVVVTADRPLDRAAVASAVADLDGRMQRSGLFAAAGPAGAGATDEPRFSHDGRVAVIDVPIGDTATSHRAHLSLSALRGQELPATLGQLPGATAMVTGQTAGTVDFNHQMRERMPWVFAFVLGLTFLVLLLAFRSVTIAATAVALNLLSVGAAYGALVLVFQHHWAEHLLGFTSNGAIVSWLPLFLFVVLFGLSMDYHVFVISRIREAARSGMTTREAVQHGVSSSAGVVTSAAVVMVAVFSIFGVLSLLDFKQLGVGLAVAVLLDATVVRAVLLPSAMVLLGNRNWWLPRRLAWLPELSHA